jgi:hypothetical protein
MKKLFLSFLTICSVAVGAHASDVPVDSSYWTDSRSVDQGGVFATAPWDSDNFTIGWDISESNGVFTYVYTITGGAGQDLSKDLSMLLIQVSDDFSDGDVISSAPAYEEIDNYRTGRPSMPGLPDDIYAIKFGAETLEFQTLRMPVWGDFYAKDGKFKGQDVYAYNTGFGELPILDTLYGDYGKWVARPDTRTVVPEPSTYLLLGTLLAFAAAVRRRQQVPSS